MARKSDIMRKRILGVTLMEILVAMVILTVGLFMVYNIFPMGLAASYRSKNRTIASELAQQKLEELVKNEQPCACLSQSGGTCRVRPLESNYTSPDYTASFDCRYYYGGAKDPDTNQVQDASFCHYDSGAKDVASNWTRFPDNNLFWYHIEVTGMVDPARKYRDTANLVRITVTVRGPITSMSEWQTVARDQRKWNRIPTEVFLTTLRTNPRLPNTTIDTTYNTGSFHNGVWDNRVGSLTDRMINYDPTNSNNNNGRVIRVRNVRNFTMFNFAGLSSEEKIDIGKVEYKMTQSGVSVEWTERAGNCYGLDNVKIVRYLSRTGSTPMQVWATQTNKIMKIDADLTVDPSTSSEVPGALTLYDTLYVDQDFSDPANGSYGGDTAANYICRHADASIVNKETYANPPGEGDNSAQNGYMELFASQYLPGTSPYLGYKDAGTKSNITDQNGVRTPDMAYDFAGTDNYLTAYKYPNYNNWTYNITYYVFQMVNIKKPQ